MQARHVALNSTEGREESARICANLRCDVALVARLSAERCGCS